MNPQLYPKGLTIIGGLMIGLTIVSLGYSIYNNYTQHKRLKQQDMDVDNKLKEIEANLKIVMGNKYVKI